MPRSLRISTRRTCRTWAARGICNRRKAQTSKDTTRDSFSLCTALWLRQQLKSPIRHVVLGAANVRFIQSEPHPGNCINTLSVRSIRFVDLQTPNPLFSIRSAACTGCPATDQGTSVQATRRNNLSVECTIIFPRRLRIAPLLCHSLKIRLAVYGVIFAALANSSLVISNSMPPDTL